MLKACSAMDLLSCGVSKSSTVFTYSPRQVALFSLPAPVVTDQWLCKY